MRGMGSHLAMLRTEVQLDKCGAVETADGASVNVGVPFPFSRISLALDSPVPSPPSNESQWAVAGR